MEFLMTKNSTASNSTDQNTGLGATQGQKCDSQQTGSSPNQSDSEQADEASQNDPSSLSGLLKHVVESTSDKSGVRMEDLFDSLDSRGHGPMLLLPAIIAISPIGMIPGASLVTGTLLVLIAGQMIFFSGRPWIPQRLANFEISHGRLKSGVDRTLPWVKWFEKILRRRLDFLVSQPMVIPIAIAVVLLAISFYPLSLVPFGVFAPGFAIALFGLGLTAKDGLLVGLGFALTAFVPAALWFVWY